jgi:hypothetical protein
MINNDFTPSQRIMIDFYTNQYNQTTNQIQILMDKQSDLTKLIRELNDYQYLLVSRQNDLLRSLNGIYGLSNSPSITETNNSTFVSTTQEPLSETTSSSFPSRPYPNRVHPVDTPRPSRVTDTLPQIPPRTTNSSILDNYFVYTFLPDGTARSSRRNLPTTPTLNSTLIDSIIDEFLNPVSTAPSNEQIQEATRSITYRDITNPVNTSCPISLNVFQEEDVVLQIYRCRHNYTPSSLLEWFRSNNHCPLCRIDIRNIVEDIE